MEVISMVNAAERFFDQDPRQDSRYDRVRSGLSSYLRQALLGAFLDETARHGRGSGFRAAPDATRSDDDRSRREPQRCPAC
jgi:hypothetical protein